MKKLYFLLVALIFVSLSTTAQNDPNAKKVLDQVSARLKTFKGITANFSYLLKEPYW